VFFERRKAARFSDRSERDPGRAADTLGERPVDIVAITLFSPDSWPGAVTMSCPEQDDPRLHHRSPAVTLVRVSSAALALLALERAEAPAVIVRKRAGMVHGGGMQPE